MIHSSVESQSVRSVVLGHAVQLDRLMQDGLSNQRIRDACAIVFDDANGWLFDYGVFVAWGMPESVFKRAIQTLQQYVDQPLPQPLIETYGLKPQVDTAFHIQHDVMYLDQLESLTTLALSHALAQSLKLRFFESSAQEIIQSNIPVARELAVTGKTPMSRRSLAKRRGVLFDKNSEISLQFNLLDTPEFFWDYPEVEHYYRELVKYLDLTPRIEILNYKLSTMRELLDMLASEQHHKHSAFLEWIIIVLIAIDIVIYFFPK